MFNYALSTQIQEAMDELHRKDRGRLEQLKKKIKQIADSTPDTINHYKNMSNPLNDRKRVHVHGNFTLTFKVFQDQNFIQFMKYEHHE